MLNNLGLATTRFLTAHQAANYFRREFTRAGRPSPNLRLRYANEGLPANDLRIERQGNQYTLVVQNVGKRRLTRGVGRSACAYAYWLHQCAPHDTHITVNTSDGEAVSRARFAASVRFPHHAAIPDPHFFQSHGFVIQRAEGDAAPPWSDRSNDIVWRGGMNGNGWLSFSTQDKYNETVVQRLRMVMLLRDVPKVDARCVDVGRAEPALEPFARREGLVGDPLPGHIWLSKKFAIDIDGYSNTWSNLLVRMLYGCCVLKVESQFGFRQWYYDDLRPYEHYVPVAANMSDMAEKIEWVRAHDTEAKAIAARGQAFARTLTFESQTRRAAEIIEANWDRT